MAIIIIVIIQFLVCASNQQFLEYKVLLEFEFLDFQKDFQEDLMMESSWLRYLILSLHTISSLI